LVRQKAN